MIQKLKNFLKCFGISRVRFIALWWRLNRRFPLQYCGVWFVRPRVFFLWLGNTLARRTVFCYPKQPDDHGYELAKVAMVLGLRLDQQTARPDLAFVWQDVTHRTIFPGPQQQQRAEYFLNTHCPNIAKDHVQTVFEQVFGYPLRIDPTTYRGPCVRKSLINARHDGRIIQCPIPQAEPGYVYQRLVNNQFSPSLTLDLRTPVYRGEIPVIYKKFRPIAVRFGDPNDHVKIARPEDVYTPEERGMIKKFCRTFGLDYGGVDVMRDVDDGRLYIVDVNTTPFGPPKELTAYDRARALSRLATMFQKQFIDGLSDLVREQAAPVESALKV
jgi:hypothetical protein